MDYNTDILLLNVLAVACVACLLMYAAWRFLGPCRTAVDTQVAEQGKSSHLSAPPPAQHRWLHSAQLLFNPLKYQTDALGPYDLVRAPPFLALPSLYIIGNFSWAKKVMLGERDITLPAGPATVPALVKLLGDQNVLMSPEPRHRHLRNLIMAALTPAAVEGLIPRAVDIISAYLERWADSAEPVKVAEEFRSLTFDFIIKSIMGRDFATSELHHIKGLYKTWSGALTAYPFWDLGRFSAFGRAMIARGKFMELFQAKIHAMRQRQEAGEKLHGILGNMVAAVDENGSRLNDQEICDNLMLLLLAGHDTTSTTLTNLIAMLQDHPAAWAKLCAEQQQLLAKHGPQLTGAVLKDMDYAEAVIREVLRLRNVVASVTRVAARNTELGGYKVPAGSCLFIPISLLQMRDPRWTADEPEAFRPERMLGPAVAAGGHGGKQRPVAAGHIMPFGLGPRFCAGYWVAMAEMRVFLALLARRYTFTADTNTSWSYRLGPSPQNGLPLALTRRPLGAGEPAGPAGQGVSL